MLKIISILFAVFSIVGCATQEPSDDVIIVDVDETIGVIDKLDKAWFYTDSQITWFLSEGCVEVTEAGMAVYRPLLDRAKELEEIYPIVEESVKDEEPTQIFYECKNDVVQEWYTMQDDYKPGYTLQGLHFSYTGVNVVTHNISGHQKCVVVVHEFLHGEGYGHGENQDIISKLVADEFCQDSFNSLKW